MLTRKRKRELQATGGRKNVEDEPARHDPRSHERVETWAEEQLRITLALIDQAERKRGTKLRHAHA